ncbi:hypothetical protein FOXG_18504 [Fusarium oxysporum f. sp. lycopersici 4287]|uniref:Uncharacterized protein n=2 Tax=Fusarium oxysporum TaxID=5507 RepID=A0A0J9UI30_FUSO4|nr:hypothetical protein FOXG_18504 [Fusarium oxysporum f. sp. lycopersici 4287]XP_018237130.1 hypothetical protein FOXG_18504 [Fusarium oxysporum f. sp. lycopersici 4287]XP_018237131.1 hypothetical protein FOXG_18504 [Fusarium oxysporum f. sp. lycopersici 4287]XP_018237132.1 hypothetical protein FOXG_18504 [Fusarium oxysporum f. sp. lycopersici 4287]XP_018237133.1 hypothetical protein FOXG_18504 [Fusarium oxysporum f. sp. lycopersici 4287]XP_018237134.1 hypothetical protein FOXG_18504 [Fusariu
MRRPPKRVGGFSVSNARLGSNTNTFFLHLCSDTRLARREAEMKQFDIVFPALAQVILRPANRVWEYVLYIIVIFSSILPACLYSLLMLLPHMAEKHNWSRLSDVANPSLRPSSISSELFMSQSGVYTYALVQ